MERVTKGQKVPVAPEPRSRFVAQALPAQEDSISAAARPADFSAAHEDASRYCPVCSQRLESRRCKLICQVCGYYMSCADYY